MRISQRLRWATVCAAAFSLFACGGGSSSSPSTSTQTTTTQTTTTQANATATTAAVGALVVSQ
jgi:hypothetical protein